jgi:hypothetical protein
VQRPQVISYLIIISYVFILNSFIDDQGIWFELHLVLAPAAQTFAEPPTGSTIPRSLDLCRLPPTGAGLSFMIGLDLCALVVPTAVRRRRMRSIRDHISPLCQNYIFFGSLQPILLD